MKNDMADIELVIKIPEEAYKWIRNEVYDYSYLRQIILGICKGTPLPKGHGRIVDISKIEYLKALHDAKYGEIPWSEAIKRIKNSAPTIIEADKE